MSKKHKKQHKGPKLKSILKAAILEVFQDQPKKLFNYKQIASIFQISDSNTRKLVIEILTELSKNKQLKEVSRGKYTLGENNTIVTGVIDVTRRGAGYVINDVTDDIFIPPSHMGTAFHGDTVKIKTTKKSRTGKMEGRVLEVVKRQRETYVGTVQMSQNFAFVIPDDSRIHVDFFVPKEKLGGAKDDDKVVVRFVDWPSHNDSPYGEVKDVLGPSGAHETEIHAILALYNLPKTFDAEVELAAEKIPALPSEDEIKSRRDFRDILTFTIDPHDAKDFDDALSFRKMDNGHFEIGVHIADVAHYVTPGSIIDKEAYSRATSVYLVDRVVPMLPEKLSNGVCSLRPNEDKLTYSVVFEMDENAKVRSSWIGKTAIHSNRRFTYEEAQERIESGSGDLAEEICQLNAFAQVLRKHRLSKGALEIESEEVKFNLDEKGKPTGVYTKVSKEANKLIEEFMLLANKYVAMSVGKPEKGKRILPFVYRIHEPPDPEKLTRLVHFLDHIGYKISNLTPQNCTQKLNALLSEIKDEHVAGIIKVMAIRTMSKAIYAVENLGHYGLSFQYYSHFTSPIRRYPDLIVHRLLFDYENGRHKDVSDYLQEACKHTSTREKLAADAERESIKYKQVEFLEDKVGLVFEGLVSGVSDFGIFVEIKENKCEGMIRLRSLSDDIYYFDEERYCVIGKRHKRTFFLGDTVDVRILSTDLHKKQIEFELTDEDGF